MNRNDVVLRDLCVFLRAEDPGHDTRQPLRPEQTLANEVYDGI